ncbi:MAG: HAMP domain-containing sensor histidine kinase, partial [Pseudomonadota bacterium]|nr:HAMP domain-containing sensor histidine kinase [Pseudomonadota bacterium]
DDLLLLARAEMHEFTLDLAKTNLKTLLEQQTSTWQKVTKPREFKLEWAVNRNVHVFIDEGRLLQALTILIENAHKYSHEGQPITLKVSSNNDWVTLSVIDIGDGISSGDLEHVFERFVRLKRKGDGMGLGLSIAKAIAEAHGGKLEAHSTLGKGSEFVLAIKASPESE